MINLRDLDDKLGRQDADLRQTFEHLIAGASPGTEPAVLLRIVAEGLAAIHERQHTAIHLTAQLP